MNGLIKALIVSTLVRAFLVLATSGAALDPSLKISWPGFTRSSPLTGILVKSGRAYIPSTGPLVFDVTNPEVPRAFAREEIASDPYAPILTQPIFEMAWPYIYVSAVSSPDIAIKDISNPAGVWTVGYVSSAVTHSVSVSGSKAFIANTEYWFDAGVGEIYYTGGQFFIYDVTDPAHPAHLSGCCNGPVSGLDPKFPRDYYGAAAEGNLFATQNYGGLYIDDFSTGSVQIRSTVPVKGRVSSMKMANGYLYCLTQDTNALLTVVDVRDPAHPNILSENSLPSTGRLWIDGHYLYVAATDFHIFDISNPAAIRLAAVVDGFGSTQGVAVNGQTVYAVEGTNGLKVLEFSQANNPVRTKQVKTGTILAGLTQVGSRLFALDNAGLKIFDASDPQNPALSGSYNIGGAVDVAVKESQVFVASTTRGLEVLDLSAAGGLVKIGSRTNPIAAAAIVGDHYLYVSSYRWSDPDPANTGVHVIDISNPAAPASVARLDIGTPGLISVRGNRVYAASNYGWLTLDVSDPANPSILATNDVHGGAVKRVISTGGYAYVLRHTARQLTVVDLENEMNPVTVGTLTGLKAAADFTISGGCAYVADGIDGVKILNLPTEFPRLEWSGAQLPGMRQFKVLGPAGMTGRILRSEDLQSWEPAFTVTIGSDGSVVMDSQEGAQGYYVFVSP